MKKSSLIVCAGLFIALVFLVTPAAAYFIDIYAGDGQSAPAGTAVATAPSVIVTRETDGTPREGITVTFVASGDGSVTGGSMTTGADGIATAGSWTLGTTPGSNTLTATAGGLVSKTFTATGTALPASKIEVYGGNSQSAPVGTAVVTAPSVIVRDATNNPVSGVTITFAVATGGGTATGLSATTGSNGVAYVGSWTLGPVAGSNSLTAASGSLTGSPITFTATGTSATSAPAITSITPISAVNSGSQTIVIVGSGFSGSTVTLTKTGQSTITSSVIGTDTATILSRNFNLNGISAGTWNLVILNSDGGTTTGTFNVNSATSSTVTAISPTSGVVNTSVYTTITGTGFVSGSSIIRLYRYGNYIGGSVNSGTATQITGTFNLNQAAPGTYDVCVLPDGTETSKTCSPTFTILATATAANGSIVVQSAPTMSKIFLDNVFQGYTTMTLNNIAPNTYTVMVRSAGYNDYAERVTVTAGNISYVTASLVLTPDVTTATTTTPRTTVSTMRTTVRSTVKVPTPWPTATPAPASPVSILAILGAAGVGFIVLRKP